MITLSEMSMLTTLYTQPHRTYHNINHINDCLTELENIPREVITDYERQIIETAIWYHDAVYNPYSKRNEMNSAELYTQHRTSPKEAMSNWTTIVCDAILATANHTITQAADMSYYIDNVLSLTTQVMLDIDLAGFGKSWKINQMYADNIRKEYYLTEELEFYTGRLAFLNTINKRESLYYTDYFKKKYHKQSKKNLEQEIILTEWQVKHFSP